MSFRPFQEKYKNFPQKSGCRSCTMHNEWILRKVSNRRTNELTGQQTLIHHTLWQSGEPKKKDMFKTLEI